MFWLWIFCIHIFNNLFSKFNTSSWLAIRVKRGVFSNCTFIAYGGLVLHRITSVISIIHRYYRPLKCIWWVVYVYEWKQLKIVQIYVLVLVRAIIYIKTILKFILVWKKIFLIVYCIVFKYVTMPQYIHKHIHPFAKKFILTQPKFILLHTKFSTRNN